MTAHAPEQRRKTPLAGRGSLLETLTFYFSRISMEGKLGRDWWPSKTSRPQLRSEDLARAWLKKQAIWQIYLPAPRHIPRPKYDISTPNEVHQADLLFLPHDRVGRKTFRYALTVVASRYKEAEPQTSKTAAEVADGLARIYTRSPLR